MPIAHPSKARKKQTAGFGTRFLPATKAIPKEMLTIIDKPLIEYAVEEAISAGAEEIIFITSHTKPSIEKHFSEAAYLEAALGILRVSVLEKLARICLLRGQGGGPDPPPNYFACFPSSPRGQRWCVRLVSSRTVQISVR